MELKGILAFVIVIGSALLIIILSFRKLQQKLPFDLRPFPALKRLQRAIGLAVEDGKRQHLALGSSSMLEPTSASALVGLSALDCVTQLSIASDRPPVATSGDGTLSILSQDTMRAAYLKGNAVEQNPFYNGRLVGINPSSYIAGTLPVVYDEYVSTHLLIGSFGPEIALVSDAADRQNAFVMASSDSLPAQSVLFAAAQEPLIGEELFAVPAYLKANPAHRASLHTQDILRWILIIALVIGSFLKLAGVI